MPYCPSCGEEIDAEYVACPHCGARLSGHPSQQPETSAAADESGHEDDEPEHYVEGTPIEEHQSRRSYLKLAGGLVAIGGGFAVLSGTNNSLFNLLGGFPHQNVGKDAWEDRKEATLRGGTSATRGTVELEPGEYTGINWEVWGSAGITIYVASVETGHLDIWTIRKQETDAFRNGNEVSQVVPLSKQSVTEETLLMSKLSPGKYSVIFENSDVYGSEPDGKVVATVAAGAGEM